MIIIISKIQVRRGLQSQIPGAPTNLNPLVLGTGLDVGEIAFTTDSGRFLVGSNPAIGSPNYLRSVFPYQNIEVLTENSPRNHELFDQYISDQGRNEFFVPTTIANGYSGAMTYSEYPVNLSKPSRLCGSVISALLDYHAFTVSANGTISSGGTSYAPNDFITLTNNAIVKVNTVNNGVVATFTITSVPTSAVANPVPQLSTTGSGTGATFSLTTTYGAAKAGTLRVLGDSNGAVLVDSNSIVRGNSVTFSVSTLQSDSDGVFFTLNVTNLTSAPVLIFLRRIVVQAANITIS